MPKGRQGFLIGEGKKNEEDRGRAELLEVIISSARLLVSTADGRMRLTAALDLGTAAGLLGERSFPRLFTWWRTKEEPQHSSQKKQKTKKQPRMVKSDTISGVIYSQLAAAPPLPARRQTVVPLALMKETANRRRGSTVGGEALYDDVAPLVCVKDNIFS